MSLESKGQLRFDEYLLDPRERRLERAGREIHLAPKAFDALLILTESPGTLVDRATLRERLWSGIAIEETTIARVIADLRKALDEVGDTRRYIETVPKFGYRFIGQVIRTEADPQESVVPASPSDGTSPAKAGLPAAVTPSQRSRVMWALGMSTAVTLAALAVLYAGAPSRWLHFQKRDWVVITQFQNRTGEELLDGSLESALESELSRSAFVNVAPHDRIGDTLRLMRQNPDAHITEELARQVAVRDGGIRAVLAGRIDKFGSNYLLSVRVVEPVSGITAAAFERKANQDQLLTAVQDLSREVRRELGEHGVAAAIPPGSPLERATTASLPALRAFSAGMKEVNQRRPRPAAELLEVAVREDPQFALAHIYAAHCYANLGHGEEAAPHFEAAFHLAGEVTDRERLFILGSYYSRFVSDDKRALEAYEALGNLYPDDYWGANNLVNLCLRLRLMDVAIPAMERKAALRPNDKDNNLLILWRYYSYGARDPAKARRYRDEGLRLRRAGFFPPNINAFWDAPTDLENASGRWWRGDVRGAAGELADLNARARDRGDNDYFRILATTNLVVGKIGEAMGLCRRVTDAQHRAECLLRVAFATGNLELGKAQLREIDRTPVRDTDASGDATAAVWCGEIGLARKWANPGDVLTRGLLLMAQKRPQDAFAFGAREKFPRCARQK